jgi:hypothetical protein
VLVIALSGCFIKPGPPGIAGEAGTGDDARSGDAPSGGGPDSGADGGTSSTANIVFITSGTFTPDVPAQNLTGADALCNESAAEATPPIHGNFTAWFSGNNPGEAAIDRIRVGNVRGWRLVDGTPFADTVDDIAALNIMSTPHLDENGHDVLSGAMIVQATTGSDMNGNDMVGADALCSQGRIEIGEPAIVSNKGMWSDAGHVGCSTTTLRLYCFQHDFNVHVP